MKNYKVKSPILLLIFNRPDTTQAVFDEIKTAKPSKLYIAADGPRGSKPGEKELCQRTIESVSNIDWECEVKTLFRDENMGCKEAVSSAITWFFNHEEEGIILEDDCLPAKSFFYYCDTLLDKYRHDTRIRHISGCNSHFGVKWGEASIFFENRTEVWGWASWRRAWKDYDKDLKNYTEDDIRTELGKIFSDSIIVESWVGAFNGVKSGKIDTWDYQLAIINYLNSAICISPNVNLISNIGYRADATHSIDPNDKSANIPLEEIDEITYPKFMVVDKKADYAIFNREYKLDEYWEKYNAPRKQLKRLVKSEFKRIISRFKH